MSDALQIKTTYEELKSAFQLNDDLDTRANLLTRSYLFSEIYTMFDLYDIDQNIFVQDTFLICNDGKNDTPVIMKKRPPLKDKFDITEASLVRPFAAGALGQDFDMYTDASLIVRDLPIDKAAIMVITNGKFPALDKISVLVALKTKEDVDLIIIDPGMTMQYDASNLVELSGLGGRDARLASNAHQTLTSADFVLKFTMVEVLFQNVTNKRITIQKMNDYGTLFSSMLRVFFPVCVMLVLNTLPYPVKVGEIKEKLSKSADKNIMDRIVGGNFETIVEN